MKEHPKSFTTDEVKAILDGRKTMFREVIKLPEGYTITPTMNSTRWAVVKLGFNGLPLDRLDNIKCPYQVGDRLWVRESFKYIDFCLADMGEPHPRVKVEYKADGIQNWVRGDYKTRITIPDKWRSSIHMPRWASRITLEITEVRAERLQEITEEDLIAEGYPDVHIDLGSKWFVNLWDSLNPKYKWEFNPWDRALSFKLVT